MGKFDLVIIGALAGGPEGLSAIVREPTPVAMAKHGDKLRPGRAFIAPPKGEASLWTAIRILEEHADMKLRLAERASDAGLNEVRMGLARGTHDSYRYAETIRHLLFSRREIEPGDELRATAPAVRVRRAKAKHSVRCQSRRV